MRYALAAAGCAVLLASCSFSSLPSAPIAYHPIDLDGHCAQTDVDGFREQATLKVRDNWVQALSWRLWVGQRGSCHFELSEFRQTRTRPQIELRARDGSACELMIWQEPGRVTLAHANCEQYCTPGIYQEAWPVMFDPHAGICAAATRRAG
ncbi:hypothetical protein PATSB16_38930 [Pandoraea thiooxydans]|uniref:Lipoprotein n=1 Tax=Pandoraea thiooxydans TaxID=445709 RepID=A0A0G3EXU0_9BURK|nr:hypothetical protein [Pandoraea thiooxydans]AKJ69541.1 hypothetical protein ABW99_16305 [Pandoraea thiooxydans]APR97227.1 hypothetical protein PATSB16_38930 [Pandoraea thiooxydans]